MRRLVACPTLRALMLTVGALSVTAATVSQEIPTAAATGGARLRVTPVPLTPNRSRPPVVSWSSGTGGPGVVTVSTPGSRETLFGSGSDGSATAPWLSAESAYVFRLYDGRPTGPLLARLTVGKNTSYEVPSPFDPTPGFVNRLLQILSFVLPVLLAVLALAWAKEAIQHG